MVFVLDEESALKSLVELPCVSNYLRFSFDHAFDSPRENHVFAISCPSRLGVSKSLLSSGVSELVYYETKGVIQPRRLSGSFWVSV